MTNRSFVATIARKFAAINDTGLAHPACKFACKGSGECIVDITDRAGRTTTKRTHGLPKEEFARALALNIPLFWL